MIVTNSVMQRFIVMEGVRSVQVFFWRQNEGLRDFFSLKKANEVLLQENATLRQQLSRWEQYSDSLNTVVSSFDGIYDYIPATIIKNTPNKQHNYLILNKGKADGVEADMGVVTARAVVGVVSDVSEHYCYVTSFFNNNQKASAMVGGTDYFGLLEWNGYDSTGATLSQVPIPCNAAVGDTIKTSGYSTIYPPDIPLGLIEDISEVSGMYKEMQVTLFQDNRNLKYVYVTRRIGQDEINHLSSKAKR